VEREGNACGVRLLSERAASGRHLRAGFAGENRGYRRLPENDAGASGEGVTRHPGAGAAE
jgi:hypothetical protein